MLISVFAVLHASASLCQPTAPHQSEELLELERRAQTNAAEFCADDFATGLRASASLELSLKLTESLLTSSQHSEQPTQVQNDALTTLMQDMVSYTDYLINYHALHEQVILAFDHANTVDEGLSASHLETVILAMGGSYVANQTQLIATLPDASGQSTLVGTDGGYAFAVNLSLLPVSQPFTAQSGSPACNFPLYYYSATLSDGSQHAGIAAEYGSGVQASLQLSPDTLTGTTAFSPAELIQLRYALFELEGLTAGALLNSVVPAFVPPGSNPGDGSGTAFTQDGQDLEAIVLCCYAALNRWKDAMLAAAIYDKAHAEANENDFQEQLDDLKEQAQNEVGSQAANAIWDGDHPIGSGGLDLSPQEFWQKVEDFTEQKNTLDQQKAFWKNARLNIKANSVNKANNKLDADLSACLQGWPNQEEAQIIKDQIKAKATEFAQEIWAW